MECGFTLVPNENKQDGTRTIFLRTDPPCSSISVNLCNIQLNHSLREKCWSFLMRYDTYSIFIGHFFQYDTTDLDWALVIVYPWTLISNFCTPENPGFSVGYAPPFLYTCEQKKIGVL